MGHVRDDQRLVFSHQFDLSVLSMGWWSNEDIGLTEESLKTMSRYRKITTICCAAVFALGLAACGGGDDGIPVAERDAAVAAEQAKTQALQMEIDALRAQLGLDPAGDEKLDASVKDLQDEVKRLQDQIQAAADQDRMDQEKADTAAAAAMAAKLYAGIGAPTDDSNVAARRYAAYGGAGIEVKIGTDTDGSTATLMEDKKTMVAAHHGWEGMRFAKASSMADENSYEAMVYSNVGKPMEGDALGESVDQATLAGNASGVVIPSITRTTGTERIKQPESDPDGRTKFNFPGSYQGVSGTYSCALPAEGDTCTAAVASNGKGFTLGNGGTGGMWTFKPTDPDDKTMSTPDAAYSSYGWWIRTDADGKVIVSAFDTFKGTVPDGEAVTGIDLKGTAMYMGGAAGKYALSSSTGGTNDAGHFTADVMLSADFDENKISGMVDNFMGADGEMRNWSVELMKTDINPADGALTGLNGAGMPETKWTLDGTAAAASGEWSGALREMGKDDVPQVATGTFYSHYGSDGKIVGAFGANVQ